MNKTYTNYTPDYDPYKLYEAITNANGFVLDVNSQNLCGANDWRVPTKDELFGIVKRAEYPAAIDTTYFPNTQNNWFWSSSPSIYGTNQAWYVYFDYGGLGNDGKGNYFNVRLVR